MRKTIYTLLLLISFSCSDSEKKESARTEIRSLTVYEFDSLLYKADYELTIRERDSVIIYDYRNIIDSTKNKSFRYLKYSDLLLAGPFELYKIKTDRYPKTVDFELYNSDPGVMDGMGPAIFNMKYGVLGFDNGMGTQYYFTNKEADNFELPILYKPTD